MILKALLLIGPDIPPDEKIEKLYTAPGFFKIKDDIEISNVKEILKSNNLVIGQNTRIDILTHGSVDGEFKIAAKFKDGGASDYNVIEFESYLQQLKSLSSYPLYVQLRTCYSQAANNGLSALNTGTVLVTHTGSESKAAGHLNDYILEQSIVRYKSDLSLSPEQQFLNDLTENFETAAFIKVENNGNIIKYETSNFLTKTTINDLISFFGEGNSLKQAVETSIKKEKEAFLQKFPNVQDPSPNLSLTDKEVHSYILGRLYYSADNITKKLTESEEKSLSELIDLLWSKEFYFDYMGYINPIFPAIYNKNMELIKILIEYINIPKIEDNKYSTLDSLIEYWHPERYDAVRYDIVELLLKDGANPDIIVKNKHTFLERAISNDDQKLVKLLLKFGANPDLSSASTPPLHFAVQQQYDKIIDILIAYKADPNIRDKDGNTALMIAINDSDYDKDIASTLLNIKDINVNIKNNENLAAIHLAISNNNDDAVEQLIQNKADLDAKNLKGDTPLLTAIKDDNSVIAKKLINAGVNLEISNLDGYTPLHLASIISNPEIISYLIAKNVDPNKLDSGYKTPLMRAMYSEENRKEIVEELLKSTKINLECKDQHWNTALHLAVKHNDINVIKSLLSKGANTNAINIAGDTPLHIAAEEGDTEIFEVLLTNRGGIESTILNPRYTDYDIKNKKGLTALDLVKENDSKELIRNLVDDEKEQRLREKKELVQTLESELSEISLDQKPRCKRGINDCIKPIYEPLADQNIKSKQFIDSAFLLKLPSHLQYTQNLGQLLEESRPSLVEQHKINKYYKKASNFINKYPEKKLLEAHNLPKKFPAKDVFQLSNGRSSIIIFKDKNNYKLYSKEINYKTLFSLKPGLKFSDLMNFCKEFFKLQDGNTNYRLYTLSKNLPKNIHNKLKPYEVTTDYQMLSKGKIPGIKNFAKQEFLDLSKYNFQYKDIEQLVKILLNKVKVINLDNNDVGVSGLKTILQSKNFPNLQELSVRNKFSLQDIEQLSQIQNSKIQIVLAEKYNQLRHQIQQYNRYDEYLKSIHIQEIAPNIYGNQYEKALGTKILNTVGRIQLIQSLNSIGQSCIQKDASGECMLGLAGLSYSFLAQPIENIMVKYTIKSLNNAVNLGNKLKSFKGIKPEFIIKVGAGKYAVKFAKSAAGAVAGIFDIVDITRVSISLNECLSRTNNECSDKEIRDSIASIAFSSTSFVSGIALAAAHPAVSILVGVGLIIGQGTYNSVSNIIEYENKYDTTHNENWSIFWRSFLSLHMSQDIQELAARTDYVNKLTDQAFANLQKLPNNTVAYAYGLGALSIRKYEKMEPAIVPNYMAAGPYGGSDFEKQKVVEIEYIGLDPHFSIIDMESPSMRKYPLSRVLPKEIKQVDMICLPEETGYSYEDAKESDNSKYSKYHCDNAVVMQDLGRTNSPSKNPHIIYDLTYINVGHVIGSKEWNNIFYIHDGGSIWGGENVTNHFIFLKPKFVGQIRLAYDVTNIIDTSQLSDRTIKITISRNSEFEALFGYMSIDNNESIFSDRTRMNIMGAKTSINIYGGEDNIDIITCDTRDFNIKPFILVNTAGGRKRYSSDHINNRDKINNCTDVVVSPNTNVAGDNNNYRFYIKAGNSDDYNGASEIDIKGNATVTFVDIELLKDCKNIYYFKTNNTMSFEIISSLNKARIFTLELKNYQNQDNSTNYMLFDKYGTHILPKLSDEKVINRFELHMSYPNQEDKSLTQELQDILKYQKYLKRFTLSKKGYEVLAVMEISFKSSKTNMVLGSSGEDIINLGNNAIYAQGNEREDIYIVDLLSLYSRLYINNKAADQMLDILYIPYSINNIKIANIDNHLKLTHQENNNIKVVDILDYFKGTEYQHLMLLDEEYNGFIPFNNHDAGLVLAPFYRASNTKNVFLISSEVKLAVIEDSNYEIYRKDNDLIFLTPNKLIGLEAIIVLQGFYSNLEQWKDFRFYKYNKVIDYNNPIQPSDAKYNISDYKNKNVDDMFTVYDVDFTGNKEIFHNIEDIYTDPHPTSEENKKIGIVRFQNIHPGDIVVSREIVDMILTMEGNENEVIIYDAFNSDTHSYIDIFEFWGLSELLEPIIIYRNSYSLGFQLSQAKLVYDAYMGINGFANNPNCLDISVLKCLIALNNVKDTSTAKALGFTSLLEQVQYLQNCNFFQNELVELKNCINAKVISIYKFILYESLPLRAFSMLEIAEYQKILEQIFSNTNTIAVIENINNQYNHQLKDEHFVDEGNYHGESVTSSATRSRSWINDGVKVIKSIFNIQSTETQSTIDNNELIFYSKGNILDNCVVGAKYGHKYVDGATCYLDHGKVMIFSTDPADSYGSHDNFKRTSCIPVEFNGQKSGYCEGEKTNIIYTPLETSHLFDKLDGNLMLGRISLHLLWKVWDWMTTATEKLENNVVINEDTQQQWNNDMVQIKALLETIPQEIQLNEHDKKAIEHYYHILEDIGIVKCQKSMPQSEIDNINNQLEVLKEELHEIENSYYHDARDNLEESTLHEKVDNNKYRDNLVYSNSSINSFAENHLWASSLSGSVTDALGEVNLNYIDVAK